MIDKYTNFFEYHSGIKARPYDIVSLGNQPKDAILTIIITTYNRGGILKESLNSALNQNTNFPYKVLLIDNCSSPSLVTTTDFIAEYAEKNVTIVKNRENYGMYGNSNQGAAIADTEYIAFLHDDDIFRDDFVEEIIPLLKDNPQISALHVGVTKFQGDKYLTPLIENRILKKVKAYEALFHTQGAPTGFVIKKEMFVKFGGYNECYHPTCDYCFSVLLANCANYYTYSRTLCYYRVEYNDSLKVETLAHFVTNDFYLRRCVLRRYHIPHLFSDLFLSYDTPRHVRWLKKAYNSEFEFDSNKALGIETLPSRLGYIIARIYISLHISLYRIFLKM